MQKTITSAQPSAGLSHSGGSNANDDDNADDGDDDDDDILGVGRNAVSKSTLSTDPTMGLFTQESSPSGTVFSP